MEIDVKKALKVIKMFSYFIKFLKGYFKNIKLQDILREEILCLTLICIKEI